MLTANDRDMASICSDGGEALWSGERNRDVIALARTMIAPEEGAKEREARRVSWALGRNKMYESR
jgi:hypothetical protein